MNLQSLQKQFPITNPDGTPSQYFLKYLQDRGGNLTDLDAAITDLVDLLNNQVIAGDGLVGGGSLANGDVTLTADVQAILDQLSTTHGAIIYRDSAAWAVLAPGTDGDVLTTHGASADPTWETPTGGGGSMTYVGKTTFSGAAQVDIPLSSSYTSHKIEFYITVATDSVGLDARITTDNFSTVKSGASDYVYTQLRSSASSTAVSSSSGAAAISLVVTAAIGNAANEFAAGEIMVINAPDTAPTTVEGRLQYMTPATAVGQSITTGSYLATTAVNGIRVYATSGNISGYYKLWGIS